MEKVFLEEFRTVLQGRLDNLLSDAHSTVSDLIEGEDNFPDPTDRATAESDCNFLLRIRERERNLNFKIRKAMQRIDEGTFGECENCGEEIGLNRLRSRPVTTLCIECKTEMESREKTGS
jgi:DnaK suppressor protein